MDGVENRSRALCLERLGRARVARVLIGGLIIAALAVAGLSVAPQEVSAHSNSTPAPNGSSPWHYSEYWALTGSWHGEGYHNSHLNDYYAEDWAIPGDGCWKRLYAPYDSMTVTLVAGDVIEMQKTINNARYRVRYRHLNSIVVGQGATVGTSTLVGYTGNQGASAGCHLHVSIHRLNTGTGWWESVPPQFCGRLTPHDHNTRYKGC